MSSIFFNFAEKFATVFASSPPTSNNSSNVILSESTNILITGGCGFIGTNMIIHLLKKYPRYRIYNIDKLDYCSVSSDLIKHVNYKFIKCNIVTDVDIMKKILYDHQINVILHFAAQSHVDNSFGNSFSFTENNVLGTHKLIECCREYHQKTQSIQKFIHISTDEVYGEISNATSTTHFQPTNPYAASKASAEHVVFSYYKSYNIPIIITRSNNIYGPYQYPEKVIPKWINLLEQNKKCPIHGNGTHRRCYIYVDDIVEAYDIIMHKGEVGEVYNIPSEYEFSNLDLIMTLSVMYDKKKFYEFVSDRAFNDCRYHIIDEDKKLEKLGWIQKVNIFDGLKQTIEWYKNNKIDNVWEKGTSEKALVSHPVL